MTSVHHCPFTIGQTYRVLRDFEAFRDSFRKGEIVVFTCEAHSRYDGMTGYFFEQSGFDGFRCWDVADDEDVQIVTELFEAVSTPVPRYGSD